MKSKISATAVRALSLLLLVSGTCALAQGRSPLHLSGLINDYTPLSTTIKGSPWEMHGQWSMDIHPEWASADFAADMTMSGFGKTSGGAVDPTQPLVNPPKFYRKKQPEQSLGNMLITLLRLEKLC